MMTNTYLMWQPISL